jgi:nucleoside 2-deoxyribosyltransferase
MCQRLKDEWRRYVDTIKSIRSQDERQFNAFDFSQSVDVILVTFSVLVGVSLADFFDDTKDKLPEHVHDWAFLMLVALLLRYLVGSAIHLKHAYRTAPNFKHSASAFLFLKDIVFLIAFGLIAIKITHSVKLFHFWQQITIFIGISLLWSVTDPIFRKIWEPSALQGRPLWEIWTTIDTAQFAVTLIVYICSKHDLYRVVVILTFVYAVFFFLDLAALLRIMALRERPVARSGRRPTAAAGNARSALPAGAIYLAGPLFGIAEKGFNQYLADYLIGEGYSVFLPQAQEQRDATAQEIFERDRRALDDAVLVLANMDGPDPDSGTCWECGYSYAQGKPVIAFRTDFRAAEGQGKAPYNLMLAQSARVSLFLPFAPQGDILRQIKDAVDAHLPP